MTYLACKADPQSLDIFQDLQCQSNCFRLIQIHKRVAPTLSAFGYFEVTRLDDHTLEITTWSLLLPFILVRKLKLRHPILGQSWRRAQKKSIVIIALSATQVADGAHQSIRGNKFAVYCTAHALMTLHLDIRQLIKIDVLVHIHRCSEHSIKPFIKATLLDNPLT